IPPRYEVEWWPRRRAEVYERGREFPGDSAQAGDDRHALRRRRGRVGARPGRNIGPGCQDHGAASSRSVGGHRVIGILPGMERRPSAGATEEEIADVLL